MDKPKRGRPAKYSTDEERIEARKKTSREYNEKKEKKGYKGRKRIYATFEEAQEANRVRARERYYKNKNNIQK